MNNAVRSEQGWVSRYFDWPASFFSFLFNSDASSASFFYNFDHLDAENGENLDFGIFFSISFKTLLYGSRALHNGNYIVFVGSNMYNNVCNFFTRDEQIRDKNLWYSPEYFIQSCLYNGIIEITEDERAELDTTDIGIYNFIEFFNGKFYDKANHEIYISNSKDAWTENIDPYEEWSSTYIEQTYAYNNEHGDPSGEKYKWNKESVKEESSK